MNLLLVGATEAVTGVLGQSLNKLGYGTKIANGVDCARRLLSGERVDVVVIDNDDHGDQALTLARWIRDRKALQNIPIMFLSTTADPAVIRGSAELGYVDFVLKPVQDSVLRDRLEKLLWVGSGSPSVDGTCAPAKPEVRPSEVSTRLDELCYAIGNALHRGSVRVYQAIASPATIAIAARNIAGSYPELRDSLLERVNAPEFGLPRPIEKIGEACAVLSPRDLAMATFKKSNIENDTFLSSIVSGAWSHMIATGFVAKRIGQHLCAAQAEDLGLAGALHGLGLVGLIEANVEGYADLVLEARDSGGDWLQLERDLLGFDHAELGARVAYELNVAGHVCTMIEECGQADNVESMGSWCLAVASVTTQRYHSDFPRKANVEQSLRRLAIAKPHAWQILAPQIPEIFEAIRSQQEVFNS